MAPATHLDECPERATIEQALAAPRASFAGVEAYPTLSAKAAVLVYSLSKSQACVDGNKRVALILLRAFLYLNGALLNAPDVVIAERIIFAASSAREEREGVIIALTGWLDDAVITTEEAE